MTTAVSRAIPREPIDLGEAGPVDVVAGDRVVEVEVPVDLEGSRDVAGVVEQHVLVGLEQGDAVGSADPPASICSASHSVVTSRSGCA